MGNGDLMGKSRANEKQLCQATLQCADDTDAKYLLWMLSQK